MINFIYNKGALFSSVNQYFKCKDFKRNDPTDANKTQF